MLFLSYLLTLCTMSVLFSAITKAEFCAFVKFIVRSICTPHKCSSLVLILLAKTTVMKTVINKSNKCFSGTVILRRVCRNDCEIF